MFHPVSGRLLLRIVEQLLAGLAELHAKSIVHRDLKPSNVMLSSSFDVKIMDYGVVDVTSDSPITPDERFLGTVRNSSPELLLGKDYDARTDLYSVGTILYDLIYGEQIFSHENQRAMLQELKLHAKPNYPPAPASRDQVCSALLAITKELLEADPEARPNSVADVTARLEPVRALLQNEEAAPQPLHGYIATALTGLQHDARDSIMLLSARIADVAKQHELYVYEPRKVTDPHEHPDVDSAAVYDLDRKRVIKADVLLILAKTPSFGVGQELEIAASYGKPTILIHERGVQVSRMMLGCPANFVATIEYTSPEDLGKQLHKSLSDVLPRVRTWKSSTPKGSGRLEIGTKLAALRSRAGFDVPGALAAELGLPARLIEAIEAGRLENIGVQLLHRVCVVLGVSVVELIGEGLPQQRQGRQDENLRRLEDLARRFSWPTDEYLDLRADYRKQLAAKGETETLSDDQWFARRTALEQRRLQADEASKDAATGDEQPRLL